MPRKKRRQWPHSGNGRCREWETRLVRGEHTSSMLRERELQVRCSLPLHHDSPHEWHGKPFGLLTREAIERAPYKLRRPSTKTGVQCDGFAKESQARCELVTRHPSGRCFWHRR